MTNINPEPGHVNVSTYSFHEWARHYYQCVQDFAHCLVTRSWSPVPYALLCRAIELELKARHLELTPGQPAMKKFGHDLEKGVILRGRLRGMIVPRMVDVAAAHAAYERFVAEPPNLTL